LNGKYILLKRGRIELDNILLKIKKKFKRNNKSIDMYDEKSDFFMINNPIYKEYNIGEWSYGHPKIIKGDDKSTVTIGKFCSIASGVQILLGGEHRKDWVTTYPFNVIFNEGKGISGHPSSKGDITIGNDVWICRNVMILSGVEIGNGAIIGAGAIVTKNVPAYAIAVGNPLEIIGYRFPDNIIQKLEEISWWNWPLGEIAKAIPFLLNDRVSLFIEKFRDLKN
jgi:acetyltransferase-like isoleucine patch superfamily enzyme